MKNNIVGIVAKNRWDFTRQTLDGLFKSDQPVSSYEILIIDNGSSPDQLSKLKSYLQSSPLPLKNLICLSGVSISKAWNLFLALSRNYQYRTKLDNDLVISGTTSPPVAKGVAVSNPGNSGINPGAIPSSPRVGVGSVTEAMARRAKFKEFKKHSAFLDHLIEFSDQSKVDLVSLVPVPPGQSFSVLLNAFSAQKWSGTSFIIGGCLLITKKCFDTIGYFHEDMSRRIDIEYSQRALKNGFNIGYHPYYGIWHIGSDHRTESDKEFHINQQESVAASTRSPIECHGETVWLSSVYELEQACLKNKFITIN